MMNRMFHSALLLAALAHGPAASGDDLLTGMTRLSCEALLCLSSDARPAPCGPALSYYFAIKKAVWPATFAARLRFLNKCPTGAPELARGVAKNAPRQASALGK